MTHIRKGEVVLPTPLLEMRKEDLKIYKSNPLEELLTKKFNRMFWLDMSCF